MKNKMVSPSRSFIPRALLSFVLCAFGIFLALVALGVFTGGAVQAERRGAIEGPSEKADGGGIRSGASDHNDVSLPLWSLSPASARKASTTQKISALPFDLADPTMQNAGVAAAQAAVPAALPQPRRNFDGITGSGGGGFLNPDTVGAVGATQYVQMVEFAYQVFDKSSGASILGPSYIDSLWAGFGGVCGSNGMGYPVVLYDHISNRWIISQAAGVSAITDECIAVSTTSDATGAYYRYGFHLGSNYYDDQKLSVWPDGYYMSTDVFDSAGNVRLGPQAFAFDRAKMIAGAPATFVTPGITGGSNEDDFLPADLDGGRMPPAGAPATFVEIPDPLYKVFHFHADFVTPANTTFTLFASPPAAGYSLLCPAGNCVPQLSSVVKLTGVGDRLMFRLAYRNFGDHEAVVGNFSVSSGGVAGIRWFELRNVTSGPVAVFQESTYQPDAAWRWLGSAAMDQAGDLAIGFSASSASINPQIRYAGRLATDALNTLAQGERHLFDGTGSQSNFNGRWGFRSSLSIDPIDDCTFWYTNEYYSSTSDHDWQTRIGSFKFAQCSTVAASFIVTTAADHDDGICNATDCTLREAINAANAQPGNNTITFAPAVTGTIQLGSPLPHLDGSIAIQGPGADRLTIRRNTGGTYRIFTVNPSAIVSMSGLTLTNGNAGGETVQNGGAILVDHAAVSLTSCVIVGNSAINGGGIYSTGSDNGAASLALTGTTISGNAAVGSFGSGGAIFNQGLSGGIANLTFTNCTFTGNTAQVNGGVVSFGSLGSVTNTLTNCTFSGNNFLNSNASLVLTNTIFYNGGFSNSNGTVTSQGHNLSNDAAGGDGGTAPGGLLNGPGDKRNTDPQLSPAGLANNGGATPTIALLANSPAINMGDDALAPKLDQRGFVRAGVSDIGAYEFGGRALKITAISRLTNGHVILQCLGLPNQVNTLQGSPDLSPLSFVALSPPVAADATGAFQYDDAGAVGLTKRFYRLAFP